MLKCENCGKKIGLLTVRYTWIEKDKRAIHDCCLEMQKLEKEFQEDEKLMDEVKTLVKSLEKKFTILKISMSSDEAKKLKSLAELENRKVSNQIVFMMNEYIKNLDEVKKQALKNKKDNRR